MHAEYSSLAGFITINNTLISQQIENFVREFALRAQELYKDVKTSSKE